MPATTPCSLPGRSRRSARRTTRRNTRRTAPTALALVLALLAGLTACAGDAEPDAGGAPAASPTRTAVAGPPPLATTVEVGQVVGRVPARVRRSTVRGVRAAVDQWIDGAYVAGPWPRRSFAAGFASFTAGARQQARRERALTSNAAIGARVEQVRATRRRVVLDLLAQDRRPAAVTARVRLAYRTEGRVARSYTVRGRLFLTRARGGWRVFGYDLAKGTR